MHRAPLFRLVKRGVLEQRRRDSKYNHHGTWYTADDFDDRVSGVLLLTVRYYIERLSLALHVIFEMPEGQLLQRTGHPGLTSTRCIGVSG